MDDPLVVPVWWGPPDAIRRRDRLLLLRHASGRREAWYVDAGGRLRWCVDLVRMPGLVLHYLRSEKQPTALVPCPPGN